MLVSGYSSSNSYLTYVPGLERLKGLSDEYIDYCFLETCRHVFDGERYSFSFHGVDLNVYGSLQAAEAKFEAIVQHWTGEVICLRISLLCKAIDDGAARIPKS